MTESAWIPDQTQAQVKLTSFTPYTDETVGDEAWSDDVTHYDAWVVTGHRHISSAGSSHEADQQDDDGQSV